MYLNEIPLKQPLHENYFDFIQISVPCKNDYFTTSTQLLHIGHMWITILLRTSSNFVGLPFKLYELLSALYGGRLILI